MGLSRSGLTSHVGGVSRPRESRRTEERPLTCWAPGPEYPPHAGAATRTTILTCRAPVRFPPDDAPSPPRFSQLTLRDPKNRPVVHGHTNIRSLRTVCHKHWNIPEQSFPTSVSRLHAQQRHSKADGTTLEFCSGIPWNSLLLATAAVQDRPAIRSQAHSAHCVFAGFSSIWSLTMPLYSQCEHSEPSLL